MMNNLKFSRNNDDAIDFTFEISEDRQVHIFSDNSAVRCFIGFPREFSVKVWLYEKRDVRLCAESFVGALLAMTNGHCKQFVFTSSTKERYKFKTDKYGDVIIVTTHQEGTTTSTKITMDDLRSVIKGMIMAMQWSVVWRVRNEAVKKYDEWRAKRYFA